MHARSRDIWTMLSLICLNFWLALKQSGSWTEAPPWVPPNFIILFYIKSLSRKANSYITSPMLNSKPSKPFLFKYLSENFRFQKYCSRCQPSIGTRLSPDLEHEVFQFLHTASGFQEFFYTKVASIFSH